MKGNKKMKYYSASFFIEYREKLLCHNLSTKDSFHRPYPVTLGINNSQRQYNKPSVIFHFSSEIQFIEFKNSVLAAYEKYLKLKRELLNV